ncbi:hypothetical protein NPX13_g5659 [Xylaria arbuscula]|uniref:Cell cycle control protein n=1 Tax=Xylaria arbuscula TaxID=114810 RepID=A0A9W8TKT7_9PEZI|nr:hypothetical protein NPX13_g5659 [Xylaria arbuscula]
MAEIPNSDTPSPYASSSLAQPLHLDPNDFDDSDISLDGSSLRDGSEEHDGSDSDLSVDVDDGTEDDEDEDEDEEEDDEDFFDHDLEFDDDLDMGDVDIDLDFGGFGFPGDEERLFVDDYLDFPDEFHDEEPLDALHQALLFQQLEHHIEQHLAHEHWGATMDQPRAGSAARLGPHRDQLATAPDVIDLTGDDGPEELAPPNRANEPAHPIPRRQSENQRRLRSQPQNAPPRLNRSDGNYVNDQPVIVLSDSDDEDRPMRASPRRNPRRHGHNHNHHHENNPAARGARNVRLGNYPLPDPRPASVNNAHNAHNHNLNFGGRLRPFHHFMHNTPFFSFLGNGIPFMNNHNHNADDDIIYTGERNVGPLPGPQALFENMPAGLRAPPNLNYAAIPFPLQQPAAAPAGGGGPAKPAHEPPKPARPGFTRDTGEDVVAICPSCEQELAYDPEDDDNGSGSTKKPRSKKAMAEHHFWAVKACGHVYCKRCFENRRPTAKSTMQVGFRQDKSENKKILCAVEDCDSDVTNKTAWVGIFM